MNHRRDSAKGTKINQDQKRSGFGVIKEPGYSKRTENRHTDSVDWMDSADYLTQQTSSASASASKIFNKLPSPRIFSVANLLGELQKGPIRS